MIHPYFSSVFTLNFKANTQIRITTSVIIFKNYDENLENSWPKWNIVSRTVMISPWITSVPKFAPILTWCLWKFSRIIHGYKNWWELYLKKFFYCPNLSTGVTSGVALTWGLLLCGAPCGCKVTIRTISVLKAGVMVSSIVCLLVWTIGTMALIIGAHGKKLLCTTLYDYPKFEALSTLLDARGVLYKNGILDDFGTKNNSVKIAQVLK